MIYTNKFILEVVIFFYTFGKSFTAIIEQSLYFYKECSFQYTGSIEFEQCQLNNKNIHKKIINFQQYNSFISSIIILSVLTFYNKWLNSKEKKKTFLLLGVAYRILHNILYIINVYFECSLIYILLFVSIPTALVGGDVLFFISIFDYMIDMTIEKERAFYLRLLNNLCLCAFPVGFAFSLFFFVYVFETNYIFMFSFSLGINLCLFIMIYYFICNDKIYGNQFMNLKKESQDNKKNKINEIDFVSFISDENSFSCSKINNLETNFSELKIQQDEIKLLSEEQEKDYSKKSLSKIKSLRKNRLYSIPIDNIKRESLYFIESEKDQFINQTHNLTESTYENKSCQNRTRSKSLHSNSLTKSPDLINFYSKNYTEAHTYVKPIQTILSNTGTYSLHNNFFGQTILNKHEVNLENVSLNQSRCDKENVFAKNKKQYNIITPHMSIANLGISIFTINQHLINCSNKKIQTQSFNNQHINPKTFKKPDSLENLFHMTNEKYIEKKNTIRNTNSLYSLGPGNKFYKKENMICDCSIESINYILSPSNNITKLSCPCHKDNSKLNKYYNHPRNSTHLYNIHLQQHIVKMILKNYIHNKTDTHFLHLLTNCIFILYDDKDNSFLEKIDSYLYGNLTKGYDPIEKKIFYIPNHVVFKSTLEEFTRKYLSSIKDKYILTSTRNSLNPFVAKKYIKQKLKKNKFRKIYTNTICRSKDRVQVSLPIKEKIKKDAFEKENIILNIPKYNKNKKVDSFLGFLKKHCHVLYDVYVFCTNKQNIKLIQILIIAFLHSSYKNESNLLYSYTCINFHWTLKDFMIYKLFESSVSLFITCCVLPFFMNLLTLNNFDLMIICIIGHIISCFVFSLMESVLSFYIGTIFFSITANTMIVIKSIITKCIGSSDKRKVLLILSFCYNFNFFFGIMYAYIYNLDPTGPYVYITTGIIQMFVLLFLWLFIHG